MSVLNGKDYLYLIWQDEKSRRQYIVGQLTKNGQYEFCYSDEIEEACKAGFQPLISFEQLDKVYYSSELFSPFASRLPDGKRRDIDQILAKYNLKEYDAYELLKRSGARLPIDRLQFVDPILNFEDNFERKIFMAGTRYYLGCEGEVCDKALELAVGESVYLKPEKDNSYDPYAIAVFDKKEAKIGYIPRYYSRAFARFISENRKIECTLIDIDKSKHCNECVLILAKVS